jgi:hypothetical protein
MSIVTRPNAGAGADDPKTGMNWEVAPGKYVVEVQLPGEKVHTENVTVGANETWGVMILPTGTTLKIPIY